MFTKIDIEIELSEEMEAVMPKSGAEEMEAIDKHSASIEKATEDWLAGLQQDLAALGYRVTVEA